MDRGRCGYDLVGNKYLREKTLTHVREVHLERLEKIKHREPGSSSTLDNNTPESLTNGRIASNPRKRRKKTERNNAIARQNKVLLQRISNILTAPPKVTDEDYKRMKKLISSLDSVDSFTKELEKKRNQQFFERVKKTTAYYHHEQWEEDYKRQLHGQKFMRQVTYTRPPDWIDPFQDVESRSPPDTLRKPRILGPIIEEKSKELSATSNQVDSPLTYRSCGSTTSQTSRLSSRGKSTSARIKELRSSHLEQLNKHQDNHPRSAKRSASSQSLKSNGDNSDSQRSESRTKGPLSKPPSRLLATCQRSISIQVPEVLLSQRPRTSSEVSTASDHSLKSLTLPSIRSMYSTSFYTKEPEPPQPRNIPREIDVTIMCSIVSTASPSSQSSTTSLHSSTTISGSPSVIFTSGTTELAFPLADSHLYVTVDGVYDTSLHCDAQIPLCELLRLVEPIGCSAEGRGDDESTAELSMSYSLASSQNSQVTHVEIEDISKEIVQLITLNYDDIAGEYSIVLPDDDESSVQSEDKQLVDVSGMTGDEALQLIKEFQSLSLSRGLSVPLESTVQLKAPESPPISITRQRSTGWNDLKQPIFTSEKLLVMCKIKRISEEKAIIKVHVVRDSKNKFHQKGRKSIPAVQMDSSLELLISLPSVLNADPELIQEYFGNIVANMKILHNPGTGVNMIVLQ